MCTDYLKINQTLGLVNIINVKDARNSCYEGVACQNKTKKLNSIF